MKRSCRSNNFQGVGTKGSVNLVEKAISQDMEFHMYVFNIQRINNNIYI